jgi:two-component system cell cycle sensor histidine kinase/response regulator CckA
MASVLSAPYPANIDFRGIFEAATGLYLVLTPDLCIVAASDQYLEATMRRREDLVGRNIFEAFPDNPDDPTATGERNLRASLAKVLHERRSHRMADQKYDIRRPDAEGGGFEERHWSPLNSPVLNSDGDVTYILHRVEDITRRRNAEATAERLTEQLQRLNERLEQRVLDRTAQLEASNDALKQEIQQRQLAEERFRRTIEAAPIGMLMIDAGGSISLVNPQAERLFGYTEGELIGLPIEVLLPERFRDQHVRHRRTYLASAQARTMGAGRELYAKRKDGSEFPVEVGLNPVETCEGSFVLSAIVDITQRQRHAERLLENARLTQLTAEVGVALNQSGTLRDVLQSCAMSLVENLEAAFARVWTLNASENVLELQASAGIYTHLNGTHARVPVGKFKIGRIAEERQPHLTNDVLNDPRVSDPDWARREKMVAFAGYPLVVEDRLVGVIGLFARHTLSQSTLETMGAIANQIATGIERKRTEERLQFTQFTIDHVATPVFWTDERGRFFHVNDAACELTGYTFQELLKLSVSDIDSHILKAGWGLVWNELQQRGVLAMESEIRRKDGKLIPINVNSNLLKLEDRKYSCTFIQNIADRRRLEEQLRQSQKMEAVGQLAGGVAHNFNNLLTVITGYSEIVLESLPPNDPLCEMVEEIQKAAHRSSSLTRQLLAFSRKQVLAPKVLDLNEVVRDTEKMLRRVIGEDVQLTTKLHSRLAAVKADPGQLEQVLLNLAVNARDAMPQGGVLTIETNNVELDVEYLRARGSTRDGLHVMLAVTDSGFGMNAEVKRHIFEPFFTTKEQGKGTGLGLAVVHGVVKQSGGHVEVYSEPGIGTSFKIYLPSVNQTVRAEQGAGGASHVPLGVETVLIVEDEDGVRNLSRTALIKYGYAVLVASSPGEAVQVSKMHGGAIDLLLTDVVMPQMNGRRLADLLRSERPEMKVVYMSGYTDDAVVQQGVLEAGVHFLHKPFSPAALGVKVREVLDGATTAAKL